MTEASPYSSTLARQLLDDMKLIDERFPALSYWAGYVPRIKRDVEREAERSRVLVSYVAHLLDRVEQLERRA